MRLSLYLVIHENSANKKLGNKGIVGVQTIVIEIIGN